MELARLKDVVECGSPSEMRQALSRMQSALEVLRVLLLESGKEDPMRVHLSAILRNLEQILGCCLALELQPIALLAWCTRSAYELDLRCHWLIDENNCAAWVGEALSEKIDLLETLLKTDWPRELKDTSGLPAEIKRVRGWMEAEDIRGTPPLDAAKLAAYLDRRKEHETLFHMLSYLVHPSAYVVSATDEVGGDALQKWVTAHLQFYALDVFETVRKNFDIASDELQRRQERRGSPR